MKKPMYLHGLEGSPRGTKGAWMTRMYDASAPEMPARSHVQDAFSKCVAVAREALRQKEPSLIVGSSYGGAVLLQLVLEGTWSGPCVFLAQAGIKLGVGDTLPPGVRAILIHALHDDVVPHEDSRILAENSGNSVELWTVEGDHRLHHITDDGTLQSAIDGLLNDGH